MPQSFKPLHEFPEKLSPALEWCCQRLGRGWVEKTRAGKLDEKLTNQIEKLYRRGLSERESIQFALAHEFAEDLLEVYLGLRGQESNNPSDQALRQFLTGPESESSKETHRSRNIGFELRLGSRFIRAGFEVAFEKKGGPDLIVSDGANHFSVECKRPASVRALQRNLRETNSQLKRKRAGKNRLNYSVSAISISHASTKGLWGQEVFLTGGSSSELAAKASELNDMANSLLSREISELAASGKLVKRYAGHISELRFLAKIPSEGRFLTVTDTLLEGRNERVLRPLYEKYAQYAQS